MGAQRKVSNGYETLADSLVRFGIDADLAPLVAKGLVAELRLWCWAKYTDVVGLTVDLAAIMPGPIAPAALASMFLRAGILRVEKGRLTVPSAYSERPMYIDRRWRRASPSSFHRARLRDRKPRRRKKRGRYTSGIPGERELRAYWCQQWSVMIGGGAPYPFDLVDTRCIRKLIRDSKDMEHAKSIIDAYFRCRDHWYAGKPLSKLVCELGSWG